MMSYPRVSSFLFWYLSLLLSPESLALSRFTWRTGIKMTFRMVTAADLLPCLLFLVCFFLGSIPFGALISRIAPSGSPQVTSRRDWISSCRYPPLCAGCSKGVLAVFLARSGGSHLLAELWTVSLTLLWMAGFAAVLGCSYSPWVDLKARHGMATGFGALLILSPLSAIVGLLGFAVAYFNKRLMALSSISGLILAGVAYLVMSPLGLHLWVGAAMLFLILVRYEGEY